MAAGKVDKNKAMHNPQVPDGLGVRIPGFHPGGPGSIPGLGVLLFLPKPAGHQVATILNNLRTAFRSSLIRYWETFIGIIKGGCNFHNPIFIDQWRR